MKKLLALVLALVMSMSLVTISNAAFSDAKDIEHTEAVEVMNALGVIAGLPDGSFGPEGNVTRAQMAKMITVIMLGDVDPAAFVGTTTDLTDISGHWAEGYIKYCYSQGVIAGTGAGKFEPEANVTAVQAAKMLLVAIGYNATVQGYVGADWAINIIRDAQVSKFFDGLSVTANQVLTRDDAAQMIYNAIDADLIEKTPTLDITDGTISYTYRANSSGKDLLSETFGCKRSTLTFLGDSKFDTSSNLKETEVNVGGHTVTYTMANGNDWLGETVEVLWKDNATKGTRNSLDKYDTVYGIYNNGETEVLRVTSNDIKSASDYNTAGKIKVAGVEYKVVDPDDGDLLVLTNYGTSDVYAPSSSATVADAKTAFSNLSGQNGNSVKFIFNDDGKVILALVTETTLGTVTAVNSEKVTISNLGSIKLADNSVYAGIAKNDVVAYTKLYSNTTADAYVIVEKAEVVSGEVTGFKGTESVTLGGTTYKIMNKVASMPASVGGETGTTSFANSDIGETFDLYLVNGYVAAAVQTSESASNYSLVLKNNGGAMGDTFNPMKIEVMAADGTKSILVVDKDSVGTPAKGDIITYTGSADKALVKIETAWSGCTIVSAQTALYSKTAKTFAGTVTAADAVVFVQTKAGTLMSSSDTSFKAYDVRSLNDITLSNGSYSTVVKDGKVVAAVLNLMGTPSGATTSAVYGMVTADNGTVKYDDNYYTTYTLWTTEGEMTVNLKSGSLTKGNLYKFDPNTTGYYDNASGFSNSFGTVAAIKSYDETEQLLTYYTAKSSGSAPDVVWGGETTKAVADDVKVLYVDQKDNKAGDEIGIVEFDDVKDLYNAYVVMKGNTGDDANVISVIIVETSNEVDLHA